MVETVLNLREMQAPQVEQTQHSYNSVVAFLTAGVQNSIPIVLRYYSVSEISLKAVQWFPGANLQGVAEETKVANPGDPEVTHGLLLVPGCKPLSLSAPAKVGETISSGRAHVTTAEGNSVPVFPGDWILGSGANPIVLSPAELAGLQ